MLGLKTTQNLTFSKIDSKYFSSINQFHSIYIVKSSVAVRFGKTSFDRTTEPHRTSPNCWFDRTTEPNRKVRSYTISKSCELEFYRCCTIIRYSRLLSFVGQSGKKRKNFVWNSGVVSTFTILVWKQSKELFKQIMRIPRAELFFCAF